MPLNRFRSRILALARKVVVVVVFSSFTCALLIRCMKYNYVSQWPRRLCVTMARCFKKTYIGLQLLETCACIWMKINTKVPVAKIFYRQVRVRQMIALPHVQYGIFYCGLYSILPGYFSRKRIFTSIEVEQVVNLFLPSKT